MSQSGAEHEQSRIAERGLDPDYIHHLEQFSAFTHQQIHDRVQAMNPGDMHRASEVWVTLADSVFGALTTLHATVQNALSEGMSGEMADAADTAARRFVTEATDLAEIATSTGHRILAAAYGAEALRKTVPPPLPQASPNIREELRQIALAALDANYTPIYPPAGAGIPAFNVMTRAAVDADRERQAESGSSPASSDLKTYAPATTLPATDARNVPSTAQPERPAAPEPAAAQNIPSPATLTADSGYSAGRTSNRAIGADQQKSTPPQDAIETRPAAVNPDAAPPAPTGRPTPAAKPATEWPRPNLVNPTPGPAFPDPARSDPVPGRSYPGPANPETLTQPRTPTGPLTDTATSATPPGMFAPGSRPASDSDLLHRSPAWLIRDRQAELLGAPPPCVPPTLGAEIPAARYDLTPLPDNND
ncbi:hypothetical protein ACFXHA_42705 [Nocardia sp. NPDC059240]|uniref:hypothetical protein n=1 Tax=Nocardia sp. NPDC059240 TaxID=3346786 RepID=UPI00367838A0